jgi:hypothetical protein
LLFPRVLSVLHENVVARSSITWSVTVTAVGLDLIPHRFTTISNSTSSLRFTKILNHLQIVGADIPSTRGFYSSAHGDHDNFRPPLLPRLCEESAVNHANHKPIIYQSMAIIVSPLRLLSELHQVKLETSAPLHITHADPTASSRHKVPRFAIREALGKESVVQFIYSQCSAIGQTHQDYVP